ncbi:radical SAM protein [Methanopyrus sp. SNP6]|uniref:B12-binding domain-containing radical SAM protein n=1 Tax=Methanopyrus sp. SNP6 TaxID=1937005 RepID=UPI0011E5DBB5|nr:radical SAM protein [Methanopyrus sp. SNP6]
MSQSVLVVDALGAGKGCRTRSRDVIGAGPRTVASLLENDYEVSLITYEDLQKLGLNNVMDYDIVGVSIMTGDERAARRVFDHTRPQTFRFIGGPGAADPNALLKTGADAAVIGEAEETLPELLEERGPVRGVYFRRGTEVDFPGPRPISRRFTRVNPEYIRAYSNRWAARVYVEIVRGCSNSCRTTLELPDGRKCSGCGNCREGEGGERWECPEGIPPGCGFCSVPSIFGPARSRPLNEVVREVRGLVREGVRRVVLSASDVLDYGRDDLLTDPRTPPPNVEALRRLLRRTSKHVDVLFVENVKACLLNREVAELLGEYCRDTSVSVGVETGDPRLLRAIGKPYTLKEALRAIRTLRRVGLRPHAYFVYGLPGQTMRSAKLTAKAMKRAVEMGAEKITVYRFRPIPASAFGDFPPGPSPRNDEASRLIADTARRLNEALKRRMVGKRIRVYVAEPDLRHPRDAIGWPVKGGPKVRLKGSRELVGTECEVEITGVVSDKVVSGKVVKILEEIDVEALEGRGIPSRVG